MLNLFEGMWKAVGGEPPVSPVGLTDEEARRLIAQAERDLKTDVEEMRARVEPTAETWNRIY